MTQHHPQILKLDANGMPMEWVDWQKAVTHQVTGEVSWSLGEATFSFRGGHNRITGEQSIVTTPSIIAVRGSSKAKGLKVAGLTNPQLFKRDRYICAYCGHKFPSSELSRDHVVPTSRGGKDVWTNVVTACQKDNRKKDDKTLEELGWKLLYVPYTPSHAEDLILKNRNILADQMEFLLSFVSDDSPLKKSLIKQ
jgi:5-methylcytosine-specific restriction endonuclease McrA